MKIIFSLLGLYFGALLDDFEGAVYGFFIGFLSGALINADKRFRRLEQKLEELTADRAGTGETRPSAPITAPEKESAQPAEAPEPVATPAASEAGTGVESAAPASSSAQPAPTAYPEPKAGPVQSPDDPISRAVRRFLYGGNLLVKIGIVVLFFGVSFLIKFAAGLGMFPIELRLAGVAVGAIALLIFGWRLRRRMAGYALVIQGGGIGILYLDIFASARLYELMPMGLAFVLLLVLVILSAALAVMQDSRALACFGSAGGFLAPVLTSTGEGSHVHLFAYYLLLNMGIVAIAWFRSWRVLNLLGFGFTFVIASLWGWQYYRPEHFASTEPFLITFFLFYLAIPILFALRQPPHLKGIVDGTLVFGVPLVAFALQSAMVEDMQYGAAWSAVGCAAIYIALASSLWKFGYPTTRLLSESFLALGILFTSLAIPLALDGNWTAAVWSLEGAALIWVAIRQQRLYMRAFGLLLQVGAALAFILRATEAPGEIPVLNSACVGSLLISLGGFGVGWLYHHYQSRVSHYERRLPRVLMIWGSLWWLAAGINEIDRFSPYTYEINGFLLFITLTSVLLILLSRRVSWPMLAEPPLLLLPAMVMTWLWQRGAYTGRYPFDYLGWLAWPAAFAAHYFALYRCTDEWKPVLIRLWHQSGFVFLVFIVAWTVNEAVVDRLGRGAWAVSIWALVPFLVVSALPAVSGYLRWPLQQHADAYSGMAQWPLLAWLAGWVLLACGYAGLPTPLPYIVVLNPIEIMQWLCLLLLLRALLQIPELRDQPVFVYGLGGLAFLVLNAMAARAVHAYAGVAFDLERLLASDVFQSLISILWSVLALFIMTFATRRQHRRIWFIGAGLLAGVVLKLFGVDLANVGTMTRIVSFISVGILILVIGYFSPAPPKDREVQPE